MPAEKSSLKLKKTEILQTSHQTIFAIALLSDSWNYCIYFQLINTSKHRLELFCFLFVPSILFPSLFVVVVCFLPFFFSSFKLVHHSQCISQFFSERYFFSCCMHSSCSYIYHQPQCQLVLCCKRTRSYCVRVHVYYIGHEGYYDRVHSKRKMMQQPRQSTTHVDNSSRTNNSNINISNTEKARFSINALNDLSKHILTSIYARMT